MFNCFNKSPNRVPRATAIVSCLNTKQKKNHKEYSKEQTCPFQIEVLHKKTVMCFHHEEKCYGALYNQKNEDSKSARDEMTPKKIDRLKNKFPKLEL